VALVDDRGVRLEDIGQPFDRQPPQDITAEQSVLGGMLLSKDAIADVVEVLRPGDFYRPAHQALFNCVLDLYGRGEPADPVTVSSELERRGELLRVGGAPYLHTLISIVPTAANAGYYAEIVAAKAVLRRLVEAGTRIVQLGYHGSDGAPVDEVVDRAQAAIYEVTERRMSEDYIALEELLQPTMDEIDAIASRGGASAGVPTGFADLDAVTNGLHPGQMVIIAARPGIGKALALDTPLPTPTGWTTMGEVAVGDTLLSAVGQPTTVVAATNVMRGRPCYEVEFSDGSIIVADGQHQWLTETRAARRCAQQTASGYNRYRSQRTFATVRTTEEIAVTLRCCTADQRLDHSVVNCRPLDLPGQDLLIPPYSLGVWLGDGFSRAANFTSADPEIAMNVEDEGLDAGTVQARLRKFDLLGKHIPSVYLRASLAQRRALLAGLLDTDGTVTPGGSVQFSVTSARLAHDVRELVVSLGCRCELSTKQVRGRTNKSATAYTITFSTEDDVFRLERKRLIHKQRQRYSRARSGARYIVDVRPVRSVPVRCVQVDNGDHLYLAGESMIPTHNSTLGLDFVRSCSVTHGMTSVIFSLEMSRTEIVMRLLSAEARIRLADMRSGRMSDDDWTRLARRMGEVSEAPLFIDDSPNMTMMEIRAKARRLKQRHDLRLIVVDYMQLMTSGKKVESRQQEVSEFSRHLKLLAKELEVPVVTISQLNRGPEQRTDKKPMLADLRESGCLTAGTRILRADTGAEVTLGELLADGERNVPVWSLDERLRLVAQPLTHAFPSGTKEAFRVTLRSGRMVEATANHPFLTLDGWLPLGELTEGSRVAVPRSVPEPLQVRTWPEHQVILLAHLIGDGSFVRRQPLRYASTDEANLQAISEAAAAFAVTAVRDDHEAAQCASLWLPAPNLNQITSQLTHGKRNPIAAWLDELGLFGLRSYEKFIPDEVFGLSRAQVALFLRHLCATDGCIRYPNEPARRVQICYVTTSRRLADDVARLLLRVGVLARIAVARKPGYRDSYHVSVTGLDNQRAFLSDVGCHGARGAAGTRALEALHGLAGNTNVDTVPTEVWERVRSVLAERGMTYRAFSAAIGTKFCGSTLWKPGTLCKQSVGRARLTRIAAILENSDSYLLATNNVYWDEIRSIESIGEQPVYDATVLGTHNFIANGINLHNSLEQDADMVMLIHRPDAWERDDPRAGEADLILAKHRNGPTTTVTVAHQLHYSRFNDMAQG
jgi:replicative DNA helicase